MTIFIVDLPIMFTIKTSENDERCPPGSRRSLHIAAFVRLKLKYTVFKHIKHRKAANPHINKQRLYVFFLFFFAWKAHFCDYWIPAED